MKLNLKRPIVFFDAQGNIAAVNCLYDPNADIGGTDIGFAYPEYVTGATLEEITSGEYYEQYAEYGAPIYHLTYEGETSNAVMNVPTYSSFMAQGEAESWLSAESYGPTQIYVNMDSQTAAEGVMFLYGANWNVVMVMIWYCPASSRSFSLRSPNSALSLSGAESVSDWVMVVPS